MAKTEPKDPRSTYRKQARKVLFKTDRPFKCEHCGWVPEGVSPEGIILDHSKINRSNNLDANHINKIISDCDPANLEWVCRNCHYELDRSTEKGVSPVGDNIYGDDFLFFGK